jgi:hypothetical protein
LDGLGFGVYALGRKPTGKRWHVSRAYPTAGSCVHGHSPPNGGMGGNRHSLPLKVLWYAKPPVSPLRWGPQYGTYDSMGAKGQVSPCEQTPDGGYSVREPAATPPRGLGAIGWDWSPGARRKEGPEDSVRRHVRVWTGRLGLSESRAPGSNEGRDLGRGLGSSHVTSRSARVWSRRTPASPSSIIEPPEGRFDSTHSVVRSMEQHCR